MCERYPAPKIRSIEILIGSMLSAKKLHPTSGRQLLNQQPNVALYARVSTDQQSADAQLGELRAYAKRRGWSNALEYIDQGISGAKDSRPAWNQVKHAINQRKIDVLVVAALDRLGRSLVHLVKIVAEIQERDVELISLRENIDLGTAQGRMLAGLFSVMADYELQLIRERTVLGMQAAKARGSQVGNAKRYFDKSKAQRLRDAGMGQIKIAKALGVGVGRVNQWVRDEYLPPNLRTQ